MELKQLVQDIVQDGFTIPLVDISHLCTHSEEATNGSLFVAVYGSSFDGHDFINQAIDNGASAVISNGRDMGNLTVPNIQVANPRLAVSRVAATYYANPTKELTVIGITGTNGKTTTASIVQSIFKANGMNSAQLGTLGIIADGFTSEKSLTTPDPISLQKIFRDFVNQGITHVVMEVSSHALDQLRVADVEFDIAVFTNLSPDHLDYHHTMDDYFHAKSKLFHALPITGTAIINFDDPRGEAMAKESQAPVVKLSKNGDADIYFSELSQSIHGIQGVIKAGEHEVRINSSMVGEFNVENILSAVSVAISLGIKPDIIHSGVSACDFVEGRMEVFNLENGATVIVDYAHTPDAYEKVLSTISGMKSSSGQLHVLFGCGGDRDTTKRPEMGRIAEHYSDLLWITPDNPRSESIADINAEILNGLSTDQFCIFDDRGKGLQKAISQLESSDILVVLGKGRENGQEIDGQTHPYSDIEIIEKAVHAN